MKVFAILSSLALAAEAADPATAAPATEAPARKLRNPVVAVVQQILQPLAQLLPRGDHLGPYIDRCKADCKECQKISRKQHGGGSAFIRKYYNCHKEIFNSFKRGPSWLEVIGGGAMKTGRPGAMRKVFPEKCPQECEQLEFCAPPGSEDLDELSWKYNNKETEYKGCARPTGTAPWVPHQDGLDVNGNYKNNSNKYEYCVICTGTI